MARRGRRRSRAPEAIILLIGGGVAAGLGLALGGFTTAAVAVMEFSVLLGFILGLLYVFLRVY